MTGIKELESLVIYQERAVAGHMNEYGLVS
jgi:hypothetical protein